MAFEVFLMDSMELSKAALAMLIATGVFVQTYWVSFGLALVLLHLSESGDLSSTNGCLAMVGIVSEVV